MKHPNALVPGFDRCRRVAVRLTEPEFQRLRKLVASSRALSASDYLRWAALGSDDIRVPDYKTQRELINSMVAAAAAITASPPGPARERALEAAVNAFDRILPK